MFPYIKTGGLADVVGALSRALAARGHEVTVFLPGYRSVMESPLLAAARRSAQITVRLDGRDLAGDVHTLQPGPGLTVHFIGRDEFFDRRHLYWNGERDYDDNDARFIFFCQAVIAVLRTSGRSADGAGIPAHPVDVVHCHDWQTGMLPVLLRHAEQRSGTHLAARTVFTVHNMIYQGVFPRRSFALTGLHESLNAMEGIEYYNQISTLKAGLMYADRVTTVSPNYAREIQTPAHAFGLDGVVRLRAGALRGIRNGIDTTIWNPATDAILPARYDANDLAGKAVCRNEVLRKFGWPVDYPGPVFCLISRMTQAKGHDLLLEAAGCFRKNKVRLVVLGTGDKRFEEAWRAMAARHPDTVAVDTRFDEALSHLVMAGADFFLMPSRTEPCGLTQMYAQVYGTIPLVSSVGGLVDTVVDLGEQPEKGTGLMFRPNLSALAKAIGRAMTLFADRAGLAAAQQRAMRQDFSWESVVGKYELLYNE
jgi:starch synthase